MQYNELAMRCEGAGWRRSECLGVFDLYRRRTGEAVAVPRLPEIPDGLADIVLGRAGLAGSSCDAASTVTGSTCVDARRG